MLVALGLAAGLLTTMAGMGGGMLLTLALAAWWGDPVRAVVVSTPALLVGNAHRLALFREHVQWRTAAPFVGGAVPGALIGGLLAVSVPPMLVQVCMASAAGLAVARHAGWLRLDVSGRALAPAGLGIGVASAAGGAGVLVGPVLLSAGLTGAGYLATMSLSALSMHVGRLVAFGARGAVEVPDLAIAALLAGCIALGNAGGRWLRARAGERAMQHVQVGTAVAMVALAVGGLARV